MLVRVWLNMGLLADAAIVWLIVIAVEGLFRLFGSETDWTGLGAIVAVLMGVVGMLLQFDLLMMGVNVGLFVIWGAVIPTDDESSDEQSARPTSTDATTARTNSQSRSQSTTETTSGDHTRIFDDTANKTDETKVYDLNTESTDETRNYDG